MGKGILAIVYYYITNVKITEFIFYFYYFNYILVSRRKFAQLTKVFTRSKKRGGRQLLPPTASCDDLLDPEESSRFQS